MNRLEDIKKDLEKEINSLGYDLYHMEYVKEKGTFYLRFFIDNENGIGLKDCEKVSRKMSAILDEKDPIKDEYILEVSSPGIFRSLFTKKQKIDSIEERILVKTKKPVAGRKTLVGILKSYEDEKITLFLEDEKEDLEILNENIRKMNLEPLL